MYPKGFNAREREIFMDANATTPVHPELLLVMEDIYQTHYGNPSSPHYAGIRAKRVLNDARLEGAKLFSCTAESLIFLSGATEGINTAVLSVLSQFSFGKGKGKTLLYGATEHKAVPEALKHWNDILAVGAEVEAIAVDASGLLDLEDLTNKLPHALMVCTMGANNETGVFQDIESLEACIRRCRPDIPWLVDCVQMLGKRPIALGRTTIDYAPFSAHKLYGPKGVGALYVRPGACFIPLQLGGGQEMGARGGTENVAGIAALGKIFYWLNHPERGPFHPSETLHQMREDLLASLRVAFPDMVLNQPLEQSLPTTINFSVPGYSSSELITILDAAGIRVSAGSACSTGKSSSFVLNAMKLPEWQSEGAIRMSFGPTFTPRELGEVQARLHFVAAQLKRESNRTPCALHVPHPFLSNSAWIACPEAGVVLIIASKPEDEACLQTLCPSSHWQYQTWTGNAQEFAGFQVIPHEDHVLLRYIKTNRTVRLKQNGIDQVFSAAPVCQLAALENCSHCLIDVRENVERYMEGESSSDDAIASVERYMWIDFLMTKEFEEEKTPVFFCRSGRRARDVAALARGLGWGNAVACDASASEVKFWFAQNSSKANA